MARFFPLGPKLNGAPDSVSYDVSGFNQFEQYLAKNGKKQPKAESVITQEVLRKYVTEIKQAKLEEFRSFLDFTAMTFRDKRRQKIEDMSLADGCQPSRLIRMDSLRSSKLDGSVEAFRMPRSMTPRLTVPRQPGTVFMWHLSMPPRCIGIYSIWT